ncbi:MAG: hypothetical protein ABIO06_11305 [Pseudolysinimonas sp.]
MTTPPAARTTSSALPTLAVLLPSILVALPIAVGRLVEAVLDSANPAHVDVKQPLAYLSEILGWSFGVLAVLLVAIVVVFALDYRRARSFNPLKVPLLVLGVQIVLGVLALVFNGIISAAGGS